MKYMLSKLTAVSCVLLGLSLSACGSGAQNSSIPASARIVVPDSLRLATLSAASRLNPVGSLPSVATHVSNEVGVPIPEDLVAKYFAAGIQRLRIVESASSKTATVRFLTVLSAAKAPSTIARSAQSARKTQRMIDYCTYTVYGLDYGSYWVYTGSDVSCGSYDDNSGDPAANGSGGNGGGSVDPSTQVATQGAALPGKPCVLPGGATSAAIGTALDGAVDSPGPSGNEVNNVFIINYATTDDQPGSFSQSLGLLETTFNGENWLQLPINIPGTTIPITVNVGNISISQGPMTTKTWVNIINQALGGSQNTGMSATIRNAIGNFLNTKVTSGGTSGSGSVNGCFNGPWNGVTQGNG